MVKIIVIFSSHRTLESGGVGTHLKHLINEIAKSNYIYYVILGVGKKRLYKRVFSNILDFIFHSSKEKNICYFMNMVFSLSKELNEKLNIINKAHKNPEIIVHCHERQTVFAASMLKKEYNFKIILTLHAPFAEQYEISYVSDLFIQQFTKILEPGLTLQVDHMIAVDALQKQIVENKFENIDLKISEIINSVDINTKVKHESYIMQNYGIAKYIVVARHLQKKNGVEYAVKAFSLIKNKDYFLFIVGEGPERENIERLISRLSLRGQVFLIGRQSHEISLNIIAHAKLSLLPSIPVGIYIEATSLTMLESMLLKTPVIASNIGGLKQVLTNKTTGILVEAGNAQALANHIDEMLSDENLYNYITENAKNLIIKQYCSQKWFAAIAGIYDKMNV